MLTWTDGPARTLEQQIIFAQLEILHRLSQALRRAEAAHIQHQKRAGRRDADWADWYAVYLEAEQTGTELPS